MKILKIRTSKYPSMRFNLLISNKDYLNLCHQLGYKEYKTIEDCAGKLGHYYGSEGLEIWAEKRLNDLNKELKNENFED